MNNTVREQLAKLIDDGPCAEGTDFTASRIIDKFVVIPRADLPEVVECEGALRVDGATYLANFATPAERRRRARHYLALAEYLDARGAREAEAAKEAEARLKTRREALAEELYVEAYGSDDVFDPKFDGYERQPRTVRASIDRIRELEAKLAEAQEAQA